MNRFRKSALSLIVLLGIAGGLVAACGGGDDHGDHDHKDRDGHDHSTDKPK